MTTMTNPQPPKTTRDEDLAKALSPNLFESILTARILVVGAGGIGCELLKNLVLSGFRDIELVDLDTIDISNLNRQFLFQKQHVKQSKALVAAKAAENFNPGVKIIPHHANIKDKKFDLNWFKSFDLVMNALDNLDARRYVNKMCLDAKVTLIESGTAGYIGQATVISAGKTECFDCVPKETPKTYPVCTIRLTPSLPIHCIVWAKNYLFNQLFGEDEDSEEQLENEEDLAKKKAIEELKKEAENVSKIKNSLESIDFPKIVFEKVFNKDIVSLAQFEDLWKDKQTPSPLEYETISERTINDIETDGPSKSISDTSIPSLEDSFQMFKASCVALAKRLIDLRVHSPASVLVFDKDDKDALHFVTAASNLRAHIFGIQVKSLFDVKAMAGNIIPAIAATNAIIAGVVVMQSFKILQAQLEKCHTTFLVFGSHRNRLLYTESLSGPNIECGTCSIDSSILYIRDTDKYTLSSLIDSTISHILEVYSQSKNSEKCLNTEELQDEVTISDGTRVLLDPDFLDNKQKSFAALNVEAGATLSVVFDNDSIKPLSFIVQISKDNKPFPVLTSKQVIADPKPSLVRPVSPDATENSVKKLQTGTVDEDDLIVIE